MKCIFYKSTRDGERCILVSPSDWRSVKSKYLNYCQNEGKGCPILARYYEIIRKSTS